MNESFCYFYKNFKTSRLFEVIVKTFDVSRSNFQIFIQHGIAVSRLSLDAAKNVKNLNPDLNLIFQGGLTHDIGSIFTYAPGIDCYGNAPYIQHGLLGARLMEQHGFTKLASICKTHIGTGFTKEEIAEKKLPLPVMDFIPHTIEEKCIAWADKFYSKTPGKLFYRKSLDDIEKKLETYSADKKDIFLSWNETFG